MTRNARRVIARYERYGFCYETNRCAVAAAVWIKTLVQFRQLVFDILAFNFFLGSMERAYNRPTTLLALVTLNGDFAMRAIYNG